MNSPGGGLRSQPPGLLGPTAWAGLTFPPIPQYMMLSGQVPFQGASGQGGQSQAAEIMCKIREGRFSLDGEAWQNVSEEAKELVRGGEPESQILFGEREATGSCWDRDRHWARCPGEDAGPGAVQGC